MEGQKNVYHLWRKITIDAETLGSGTGYPLQPTFSFTSKQAASRKTHRFYWVLNTKLFCLFVFKEVSYGNLFTS